ncbi:hypothetical protein B0H10DRAFT_2081154 [Mycena sp. CBHHK59/15]|nr:hypothetical protein B0H10DRAFT_2081154 [Mycena sp. CBHHK59/15]
MAPVRSLGPHSSRLIYTLFTLANTKLNLFSSPNHHVLAKRKSEFDPHQPKFIVFAVLIPVLVLLSGVFAGLTLGYMSLDETQLNVLCLSGTPKQREYANKILPIRKNGHLLLVTLLLANMIVNESLPVISDPVLGGGVQSVVVSTVLIVIFAEIIPQSLFTRYGLYLGAKGAGFTRVLIYVMGVVAWPVAKLLEFVLGSHHGIIYRRAELKELIAMHSSMSHHGGDLKTDTVTIIGATLDLQEKVVRDAMTPIEDVFMLSIEARLDYDLLKNIVATGHSRIPVFEEVDAPPTAQMAHGAAPPARVKKILGILLVKQLVLLDPKDAVPLRTVPLNTVPFVPNNQSLLGILDKFQEGRSHIAIVSRFSVEKAQSVKTAVKRGLTQRLREKVGMGDSSDSDEEDVEANARPIGKGGDTLRGDGAVVQDYAGAEARVPVPVPVPGRSGKGMSFQMTSLEQSMPADAVLDKADANEFLVGLDPAVMPLGIITLEDVLEELIGEEIFDEFDAEGAQGTYVHHHAHAHHGHHHLADKDKLAPGGIRSLNFFRSRSVPPSTRDGGDASTTTTTTVNNTADTTGCNKTAPPTPVSAPLELPPSILVKDADAVAPPADAGVEFAQAPRVPALVRSGSLPTGADMPLEAVLLDRRRRLAAAGTRPGAPAARGRFKSSPMGGVALVEGTSGCGGRYGCDGGDGDGGGRKCIRGRCGACRERCRRRRGTDTWTWLGGGGNTDVGHAEEY